MNDIDGWDGWMDGWVSISIHLYSSYYSSSSYSSYHYYTDLESMPS